MNSTSNIEEIKKGVNLIYSQLIEVLKNEGLEIIKSNKGDSFNPLIHEVIEVKETENEKEDSIIVEEYRPAYKLIDKIIRPASVKVYKFKKQAQTTSEVE
jgi:molecular chaperone GrpE